MDITHRSPGGVRSPSPLAVFSGGDRLFVSFCLVLITALAWAYLVHLAHQMAPAMEYHTAMAAMGMKMDAAWTLVDILFTFTMWVVMMLGMMAGAAAPVLLLFATVHAKRSEHGALSTVLMFGFGYLAVWIGFSACATLAQWALHQAAMLSPTMAASSPLLGGTILVAAGVYQLSPLKSTCLTHCRSPLGFLMTSWREGKLGALQMGARHGAYCLGCCWALMCVLFVVGVMNLIWVMALTGLVLAEKVGPRGAVVSRLAGTAMIVAGIVLMMAQSTGAQGTSSRGRVPTFRVDPMWPKPLPNHWIIGAVAGVAVDKRDHVWIVHRPSTLQPNETRSFWKAAPPVLEFDPDGKLVSAWGGPGAGYEWPELEHGIFVDDSDNVWLAAGGNSDAHILKFTREGRFLMQIGRQGKGRGSNDTENLGAPANVFLDAQANELYVADGYVNHRVIVFDATTGTYKRHWGAYGKQPDDGWFTRAGEKLPGPFAGAVQHENRPSQYDPNGPPAPQFRIVHAVRVSKDGLVYVCDRTNDRLQVFRKDGTFVREVIIAKDTFGSGSVWDVGFSIDPRQAFLFINDGTNQLIYVIDRQTLEVVSTFGGAGRWAGQFYGAHNLAVNSKGDLFVTETYEGKRVQKFTNTGLGAPSSAP